MVKNHAWRYAEPAFSEQIAATFEGVTAKKSCTGIK
jgi:hypothetical protein